MNHLVKNLGNFAAEVAEGLVGYGRETPRGRGRFEAEHRGKDLPESDGYASKEGDILLGGFLQRRAAQLATQDGPSLSTREVSDKEHLALRAFREHLDKYGPASHEHYRHWMIRVRRFADRRGIRLPVQHEQETPHAYSRRLREWTRNRPEKWPALRAAAGTHLVFSPDPAIWASLRAKGADEREVLRHVLAGTLKEFADWRREQHGPGHSLGWVAGTHVHADGADRHPHIHLVVLKRDESGREVDWSVSRLKGHAGRERQAEPDPLQTIKRIFSKHVEKELQRHRDPAIAAAPVRTTPRVVSERSAPDLHRLGNALRSAARALRYHSEHQFFPILPGQGAHSIGLALRMMGALQRERRQAERSSRPFSQPRRSGPGHDLKP
ncbi:MAG: hypothetical protein IT578_02320 [Verrucomicrobiae bacterium]|nr:hypothetical protein [Verrucomicrobiae bacterium]